MSKSAAQLTLFGVMAFAADYLFFSLVGWNVNPGHWQLWVQVLSGIVAVSWVLLLSTAKDPKEFRSPQKQAKAKSIQVVELNQAGQLA